VWTEGQALPGGARAVRGGTVKHVMTILLWIQLAFLPYGVHAQESVVNDNPSLTTSMGIPFSAPKNPMGQYASFGWGIGFDAGYNFDRHHALIGGFLWNWVYPSDDALRPIRIALQSPNISGHSNVFAYTGNYRLEFRGRVLGVYLIGGPGWYYRTASLSRSIPAGTVISCLPAWRWWGYNCADGLVVNNLTEVHSNASAIGFNGGVGLTFRTGEAPYRLFVETRYHFAPTGNVSTKLIALTVGMRY
jgi:hypothetical protein